jgi:hypothetical protein
VNLSSFDDLLRAAREQPEPQRLLFVFASAELPDDSTPEQRARFEAGEGGALAPLMCVDKTPDELGSFAALVEESRRFGPDWSIVFVASLPGRAGRPPTSKEADQPLQRMIESIKAGSIGSYLPFDRRGQPVLLS